MRFLVDADLPRAVTRVIQSFGHEAVDVRDIGLRHAKDPEIASYAREEKLCLVTADWGFADIRLFPPESYCGIVILALPDDAIAPQIAAIMGGLLDHRELLSVLHGRLAIVEKGRIRLRPPV